jgi:glycerol-3-phosphate dehydrogenase
MSEHATDVICQKLGIREKCRTHSEPLPGGEGAINIQEAAREHNIPAYIIQRLYQRYGTAYAKVLEQAPQETARAMVCLCESTMESEIRYAIRHEWARTLDDVRRRTRLGCGPCQGQRCTLMAACILGEELHLSPDEVGGVAMEFLQERWKGKFPALRGLQLAHEEIHQAMHFLTANLHEMRTAQRYLSYGR